LEVIDINLKYRVSDKPLHLYALGDIHLGTIHCVEKDVERKVQEIKNDENAMFIGMGDYAEFITPTDPRWDSGGIIDWVKPDDLGHSQEQRVMDLLSPIKDKCIGLIYGNHEVSIHKHSHQDVHQHICDGLGVPTLGYSCFVRIHFTRHKSEERHLVTGCFTHGTGNAITEGAKINNLMRFMKSFEADMYGYGHVHDYIPKSLTRLETSTTGRIHNKVAIGTTTGCWFRTYTQGTNASYGEMKVYPPSELCCAVFLIDHDRCDFSVDVSRSV
jgi:hypothetical protein